MNDILQPKAFVRFDGDGEIVESKNIQGVLKTGIGEYTINPTEEDYHNKWLKDHPELTVWEKIKRWFK